MVSMSKVMVLTREDFSNLLFWLSGSVGFLNGQSFRDECLELLDRLRKAELYGCEVVFSA